jgi:predicted ATPase
MEGQRLIRSLTLQNILSYGNEPVHLDLEPLNVLIGPNGSGKSNFMEVLRLLEAMPRDLTQPIIRGGGITDWLWKGKNWIQASITAVLDDEGDPFIETVFEHGLQFAKSVEQIRIQKETIRNIAETVEAPVALYEHTYNQAFIAAYVNKDSNSPEQPQQGSKYVRRKVNMDKHRWDQSILAQRSDPDTYPDLTYLSKLYSGIRHYAEFNLGRDTAARRPQRTDLDATYLYEDASNLALVLNDLQNQPTVIRKIIDQLKLFNPRVENIITRVAYGTVQIYIQEAGLEQTIPATRLSDGTLRYLCLLVILCHPTPPPIVCIEEPELGMHPDVIRGIAEMLIEASQRTQMIVTTHSDLLVSALSAVPEAIVVCEHDGNSSTLRRLDPEKMKVWLERYSLGELWLKGEIGGTLW